MRLCTWILAITVVSAQPFLRIPHQSTVGSEQTRRPSPVLLVGKRVLPNDQEEDPLAESTEIEEEDDEVIHTHSNESEPYVEATTDLIEEEDQGDSIVSSTKVKDIAIASSAMAGGAIFVGLAALFSTTRVNSGASVSSGDGGGGSVESHYREADLDDFLS